MSLTYQLVEPTDPDEPGHFVIARERLVKTEDGRLVPEGDPDGRWFYCVKGARIPLADAMSGGLVREAAETKAQAPAQNKARARGGDK
jgi:hypothetical protein